MTSRYVKIIMLLCLAVFAFLVTFGNITDYGSNYAFVQHVLSMDTTFPGNALMYRAITNPSIWNLAYWLIILGEGITCVLLVIAAFKLWRVRKGSAAEFNDQKSGAAVAVLFGFLVWFFGFMVIGGEWFAMWQSDTWNGQDAAFKFYITMLAVLIYVNQREDEVI